LVELSETINLPKGYTAFNLPEDEALESPAAEFESSTKQNGNKLQVHRMIALKKRVYEPSDWNGFRDAVNAYKNSGNYIILTK
jgi:hypothetical protein